MKNETDATTVFDSILKNYETGNANEVVGFVEDISYVQGLYPDSADTIWDAQQLADKLNSKKSAAQYYTVEAGDTVSGIAQKVGLSTATLFAQNPGLTETIHIGQQLLISREVNYIQVQITRTETRTVSVPYETERVETSSLYSGTKRVKTKGVNGEQVVTELVTYVDGVRTSAKEVSRVTTKQPVTEVIQVGTKKRIPPAIRAPIPRQATAGASFGRQSALIRFLPATAARAATAVLTLSNPAGTAPARWSLPQEAVPSPQRDTTPAMAIT